MTRSVAKELVRCTWPLSGNELYVRYHDDEWGVPVYDDRKQFEFLTLESAQAGLSWATILNKREGYRRAFADFDPEKVARFTEKRIEKILTDPGIVRNRLKVRAAVTNAQKFLEVQEEFDGFAKYLWQFVGGKPVQNRWTEHKQVPATSPESDAASKDLKQRGFKFVGSTIIYAHMQATGLVNDHLTNCFRYKQVSKLAKKKL
jgi:DNA-3-methyladenine glycosylase I